MRRRKYSNKEKCVLQWDEWGQAQTAFSTDTTKSQKSTFFLNNRKLLKLRMLGLCIFLYLKCLEDCSEFDTAKNMSFSLIKKKRNSNVHYFKCVLIYKYWLILFIYFYLFKLCIWLFYIYCTFAFCVFLFLICDFQYSNTGLSSIVKNEAKYICSFEGKFSLQLFVICRFLVMSPYLSLPRGKSP